MKTATQETNSRAEEHMIRCQYAMLGRYKNQRARAIAMHYVRNASMAQQILRLLHYSTVNETSSLVDETIDAFVNDIAKNHAKDLGIKLEWEEKPCS